MTVLVYLTTAKLSEGKFESLVKIYNLIGKSDANRQIEILKQEGRVTEHPGMNGIIIELVK